MDRSRYVDVKFLMKLSPECCLRASETFYVVLPLPSLMFNQRALRRRQRGRVLTSD